MENIYPDLSKKTNNIKVNASIYLPKYSCGSKVQFRGDKINTFNAYLKLNGFKEISNEPLEKVDPCESAINYVIGKEIGTTIVYLYDSETEQTFKIIGSTSGISTYFNHHKTEDRPVFDCMDSDSLETAQVFGLFLDGNTLVSELVNHSTFDKNKWLTQIKQLLSSDYDWSTTGKTKILSKLDSMGLQDWNSMASLMAGTTNYRNDILVNYISEPYFIHGKIFEYYKAEETNNYTKTKGSKANTADLIITNVKPDLFLDKLKTGKVAFDEVSGLCHFVKNPEIIWFQVSLKKGRTAGKTQLGKFFAMIKKKFDIPSFNDLIENAMTEEIA